MNVLASAAPARRRPWDHRSCGPKASARSAPSAPISHRMRPAACTASTCSRPPAACTIAAASATGCITPVSLLASISETSGRAALETAAGQRREIDAPVGIDGNSSIASRGNSAARAHRGCSIADIKSLSRGRFSPAVSIAGVSASMLASVPPQVKITLAGRAPTSAATCSRARSTSRARRTALGMHRGWIADDRQRLAQRRPRLRPQRRGRVPIEIVRSQSCSVPCLACYRMKLASAPRRSDRVASAPTPLAFCPPCAEVAPSLAAGPRQFQNLKWF